MHHANIYINREDGQQFIFDILQKDLNFKTEANPDFLLIEKESFGIDDARNLEKWAIGKPLIGETKVFLIVAKIITHEAQNAMLKILEEPTLGTYIFMGLENLGGILPTFISRVMILEDSLENKKNVNEKKFQNNSIKFLNSKIREKLALIRSLAKKENKNEMKELIKNLEEVAYKNNFKHQDLKNILTAKILTSARGSSPKMLLEWLVCVLQ